MTQEELKQIAEQSWEGCDGCTKNDKDLWINGFIRAANLFSDIEDLPSPQQLEEKGQLMGEMFNKLVTNQQNLDSEYGRIISENFNDLIESTEREEKLEFLTEQAQELDMGYESPYCPVCSGCGEDGCCSAMNCKQDPNGHYCETYLKDLKFGYAMNSFFENEIAENLPEDLKTKYNEEWDKKWSEIY